jgi:Fic family protein
MAQKSEKIKKLNSRQELILAFIEEKKTVAISQIVEYVQITSENVTRITIARDLEKLVELGYLERKGAGRSTAYEISASYSILKEIDVEIYFSVDPDKREIREKFNFDIFDKLKNIFTEKEKEKLTKLNQIYQRKIKTLPGELLKKEIERLNIDFSWKSSKIEGNTYSLLETEQLIKNQKEAIGHSRDEATMILNHKSALEYIQKNKTLFSTISAKKIIDIHTLLISGLETEKNIRKRLVRITGTKYAPLDNEFQIKEALDDTCVVVNQTKNPFEKGLILMLLIAYIQPFNDGNKRTSRLSGNAILSAFNCCLLSYRSMDEIEYKKAMLLFYEQNNIAYFKKLFIAQFEFAVENYFG